jgi:hypothetical protein
VHELDGDTRSDRRRLPRGRREEDEQRPQPLAARGERLVADGGDEARMAGDRAGEPLLERVEIILEPRGLADRGQRLRGRARQRALPT